MFASAVINHLLARFDDLAIGAFTVTALSTGRGDPLCGLAYLEEVQTTTTQDHTDNLGRKAELMGDEKGPRYIERGGPQVMGDGQQFP